MYQIKFDSPSWECYSKKIIIKEGYGYYKSLQSIADELGDYQNEAEQEGWYVKTINLTLHTETKNYTQKFNLVRKQDTDKLIADYFAATIPFDVIITCIKLNVKLAK